MDIILSMIVVLTTVSSQAEGEMLAEALINAKLAACVQVLPRMTSVYEWEGRIATEAEHLLLIKTLDEKWDDLTEFLTTAHSYDVPEIIAIETEKVSGPYRNWLESVLR